MAAAQRGIGPEGEIEGERRGSNRGPSKLWGNASSRRLLFLPSPALSLTFASFSLVYKLQEVFTLSLPTLLLPTLQHTRVPGITHALPFRFACLCLPREEYLE